MNIKNLSCRLSLVLWFAAIYSALIGLGLMAIPPSFLSTLGLQVGGEPFFQVQGGAFHFLMAAIYAWAAMRLLRMRELIILAIVVKGIAALFLATYYLVVQTIWIFLASAVVDASMATLIYLTFVDCKRAQLQLFGEIR